MIEAKYAEIRDLIIGETLRVVLRTELSDAANLITERFFHAIKSDEDQEERYYARSVASGYLDIMKDNLVHGAQTIRYVSVRIVLVVAKIKSFSISVVDVKHAYLFSDNPIIRKIFITNHGPEFELSPDKFLELLKPIYGLADAGDKWHRIPYNHVEINLNMTPTIIFQSLYCQFVDDQLV